MSAVLVVAEVDAGRLSASAARQMSCAQQLLAHGAVAVDLLLLGDALGEAAAQAAQLSGLRRVLTLQAGHNAAPVAAVHAPQIVELAPAYSHLLFPGSAYGKDLAPRVAALLGVPQLSELMAVRGLNCFDRPCYAGNALTTVETPPGQLVATVRLASFAPAPAGAAVPIEALSSQAALPTHTRYRGLQAVRGSRPDLQSAARVVSGGRGVGSAEQFKLIEALADSLGAAVGASRAAVDSGFASNDLQVGQTGKVIAPALYVAVGISGAIQHLAGIKDAGVIVAINKDAEAPIFEVADYGLVGDLFQVLPQLQARLQAG